MTNLSQSRVRVTRRLVRRRGSGTTAVLILLAPLIVLGGCGGGGSSPNAPPPTTPDFSLSVAPANPSVTAGSSVPVSLSATATDGFSSQVNVQVSGVPSGVSVLPATIVLTPGNAQQVTFSAAGSATASVSTVTFTGTSGTLMHSRQLALTVEAAPVPAALPSRTRYVRTDAATPYFGFVNSHWIIYSPTTGRFFVTDPGSNHVFVLDAATQSKIATLDVPGAYGIDDTPDHSTLYVGTQIGDVYAIDATTMTVTQRYLAADIGPSGFAGFSAQVLADGRLALLGG